VTPPVACVWQNALVTGSRLAGRTLQTRVSLATDLRRLGVVAGETLLVHSSLSSLGWVCGGSVAVVLALLDVVGPEGTLVVPAQTAAENRDPSRYRDPAVPDAWWPAIRENLPGYDPAVTPSRGVGAVAEQVRTWPGALRSGHPQTSFAAVGAAADWLLAEHRLDSPLGEGSPLARLEEAGAQVLLLGVGFDKCTAFHLAEYRLPDPPRRSNGCAVVTPDGRQWVTYDGLALDDSDFGALGSDFETHSAQVRRGRVGESTVRLFPVRAATAFALEWLVAKRGSVREVRLP